MSPSPSERLAMIEYIERTPQTELIGWGMDRYERVFLALAEEREAIQDGHRHDIEAAGETDDQLQQMQQALARADAVGDKIIAAMVAGSRLT